MKTIQESAEGLEALRSEIAELDALEAPTDEQTARFAAALAEWDTKKADHDALVERAAKLDAIRTAVVNGEAKIERAFGAPEVSVKRDPFADLDQLRYSNPNGADVRARALTALESVASRALSQDHVEAAVRTVENVPGAAVLALATSSDAYRDAFATYLAAQGESPSYSAEQLNAVRTAMGLTSATGGYMLPFLLDPTIIKTGTGTKNPIRSIAKVVTGTQNVWHGVSAGNVTTYWVGEGSAFTEGSPTFAGPSITAAKLGAWITPSFEVWDDANLPGELPGLIGDAFALAEAAAFVSGSGSSAPKGIVTAISATAGSTVTATTRGSFTSASAADVYAVQTAVPTRFEDSATWVANKATYNTIRTMDVYGGGLFWANLGQDRPNQLLGSPVVSAQDMASATTSGTVLAILGDFSRYVIYQRLGTTVEFVPVVVDGSGLPTGQRGLIAYERIGADCVDINAFRFLKT